MTPEEYEAFRQILLELRDPAYPLLKQLRQKAPGTYFHSVIVSELAATACLRLEQSDPLLAQVGGLYHDIGKMIVPEAYAENQEDKSYPFRPEIIITHVEKSLEIADAYRLPESIKRFMSTHHGTQNAPQINPEQKNPYPKSFRPQSIEETLVMLADSSEAAVRAVKKINRETISDTISSVFEGKIKNDQLRDSVLITHDFYQIKEDFTDVFVALYHRRFATEDPV